MSGIERKHARDTAAHLFRVGTKAIEKDFQVDSNLVFEMYDRGLRVQDILAAFCLKMRSPGMGMDPNVSSFLVWYGTHYKLHEDDVL